MSSVNFRSCQSRTEVLSNWLLFCGRISPSLSKPQKAVRLKAQIALSDTGEIFAQFMPLLMSASVGKSTGVTRFCISGELNRIFSIPLNKIFSKAALFFVFETEKKFQFFQSAQVSFDRIGLQFCVSAAPAYKSYSRKMLGVSFHFEFFP